MNRCARALVLLMLFQGCQYAECGNGSIEGSEQCDDGNNDDVDGCSNGCLLAACGDGVLQPGETCDDGVNDGAYGGCTADCLRAAFCGDGVVQSVFETCDAGFFNADSAPCTSQCSLATCGDGLVWAGVEVCDDGFRDPCGSCNSDCSALGEGSLCGDALICQERETCDDGALQNHDACTDLCLAASCGDGFVQEGVEVCDDGCFLFQKLSHYAGTACVLRQNGKVACFGQENYGILQPPERSFSDVAIGSLHGCGIDFDGAVVCWGAVGAGALTDALLAVPSGHDFVSIAAGPRASCAIDSKGQATCWGEAPLLPSGGQNLRFLQMALGARHGCALTLDGRLFCFGDNSHGQATAPPGAFLQVAAGEASTCAIAADRSLVCFGRASEFSNMPVEGAFARVQMGVGAACAVTMGTGSVVCFGENAVEVPSSAVQVLDVAAGQHFACVIDQHAELLCFGQSPEQWNRPLPRPTCATDCSRQVTAEARAAMAPLCTFCDPRDPTCVRGIDAGRLVCDTRRLDAQCAAYNGARWNAKNVPCGDATTVPCAREGLVAACVVDADDSTGYRVTRNFYGGESPGYSVESARHACRLLGGEFEPMDSLRSP